MANVVDTSKDTPSKLEDVDVVEEYPGVFQDNLPRLPPDREIEFAISIVPGTNLKE